MLRAPVSYKIKIFGNKDMLGFICELIKSYKF